MSNEELPSKYTYAQVPKIYAVKKMIIKSSNISNLWVL